jgi:hypothetical protein
VASLLVTAGGACIAAAAGVIVGAAYVAGEFTSCAKRADADAADAQR